MVGTFTIIPNSQTPNTPEIDDVNDFILDNINTIKAFEVFANAQRGVGLSANQCAVDGERLNLRMVAVKNMATSELIIAIDPKITSFYGEPKTLVEGCLSWDIGKYFIKARRWLHVDVEYYTMDGQLHKISAENLQAQIWQHEINHINGYVEELIEHKL